MKKIFKDNIIRDTVKLTALSFAMQTCGMVFNVILSERAGTAAVGLMSLIFSLFSFIMVLANGNIFISTGRFISEARGAGCENYSRIMKYALTFSLCLSTLFMLLSIVFSEDIGSLVKSSQLSGAVRLIALSLPFASAGSCIKGYFHGIRRVNVPMKGDLIEFAAKWSALFLGLHFYGGTDFFYIMIAASILVGEAVSFFYFLSMYIKAYKDFRTLPVCTVPLLTDTPLKYLKNTFPILLSGYVQMMMSAANEVLVPAALLKFSMSSETALSQYGMFEAMIMPAIFFPSAVLTSMSNIIVPESAKANRISDKAERRRRLGTLTDNTFSKTFSYAFFVAVMFLYGGKNLGNIICPSDGLVGRSLVILAPVIPFIYLEIILEGMLKGMGRQNFSTVNSLIEYAVRIACVIIFVRKLGFSGVLISYYASNVLSNLARIYVVCRESGTVFSPWRYVLFPCMKGLLCCEIGCIAAKAFHADFSGEKLSLTVFVLAAVTAYLFVEPAKELLCRLFSPKNNHTSEASS
ncbi:MAG: polysaccharide biosynthesis C-terminal domain-containing protein [Huintestinicola sp.]